MSADVILIVGGYGHVGGVIGRKLVARSDAMLPIVVEHLLHFGRSGWHSSY